MDSGTGTCTVLQWTADCLLLSLLRGVVAVIVVFILIGVIHMPDGPFMRPHPGGEGGAGMGPPGQAGREAGW